MCCKVPTSDALCQRCVRTLRPANDRILPGGARAVAAFLHEGAARLLVHQLKYQAVTVYAELVADELAPRLPRLPLVPVPRSLSRKWRYGVDPARVIADSLGRRLGVPVLPLLRPRLHSPRRAGRNRHLPVERFTTSRRAVPESILVDDVITTGVTSMAAISALGDQVIRVVAAANTVPEVSSLSGTDQSMRR